MVEIATSLIKAITETHRKTGLEEVEASLGTESFKKLEKLLNSNGLYSRPRNWRILMEGINILSNELRTISLSPDKLSRLTHSAKFVEDLHPGIFSYENISNLSILDYGSGVFTPLAYAIFLYVNGAKSVTAIEPGTINREIMDVCNRELILSLRRDRKSWNISNIPDDLMNSRFNYIESLDINLNKNQIQGQVSFYNSTIDSLTESYKSTFDLVLSHSVLEHVEDFDKQMEMLAEVTKPGGLMIHIIDLADHRRTASPYHGLGFMKRGAADPTINGLRYVDMSRAFAKAGFEVVKEDLKSRDIATPDFMESIDEKYLKYTKEELEVVYAGVVLRRL